MERQHHAIILARKYPKLHCNSSNMKHTYIVSHEMIRMSNSAVNSI